MWEADSQAVRGLRAYLIGTANVRNADRAVKDGSSRTTGIGAREATTLPTFGIKLSQNAKTPNTSHRSRPMTSSVHAVSMPTTIEITTFPLM